MRSDERGPWASHAVLPRILAAAFAAAAFAAARVRADAAAGATPKPEMMENCPGMVARASCRRARSRPRFSLAALAGDQVRITYVGPLDLPDREPAAREDRHRLQRLRQAAGAARHRHHEPRAFDPLHRPSRSRRSSTCCAAGARARTSRRATTSQCRRRARAQRADQHPQLERRHRAARQFDLHLRDRQHVHRPSRAICTTR